MVIRACTGCGVPLNPLNNGLCNYCRWPVPPMPVAGAVGPLCACGNAIGNGVFQCAACEMVATNSLKQEHARQSYAADLLEYANDLKYANISRSTRRKRLGQVKQKLNQLGLKLP